MPPKRLPNFLGKRTAGEWLAQEDAVGKFHLAFEDRLWRVAADVQRGNLRPDGRNGLRQRCAVHARQDEIRDEQVERVIRLTLETTPREATHWSLRPRSMDLL